MLEFRSIFLSWIIYFICQCYSIKKITAPSTDFISEGPPTKFCSSPPPLGLFSGIALTISPLTMSDWTLAVEMPKVAYTPPPFPPDSWYLSGAPCQILVRWLSDHACQMPHHTSVNSNQTSVRQVPLLHQTDTTHLTDVWYMSGGHLVLAWQMSGGSWQMSGWTSDNRLVIIWKGTPDK